MQSIKVSIVVPVYKVPEQFLCKCIQSLLSQTLNEIEILLVDDGSPDNCGKICDYYAMRNFRVKVIHRLNGGLSSARNAGFSACTGDWIMFVDGDDWIDIEMCEIMYNEGMKSNAQLVMCGIIKNYEHHFSVYDICLEDGKQYIDKECKWLQQQLLVYNSNIATAYSKLISRKLLLENNIQHDETLRQGAEGLEFNLRLFEKLEKAVFINKPFYHYRYNENSISASFNEDSIKCVIKCFKKMKKFTLESKNKDQLMLWFNNRMLYVIVTTAISGYFNPSNKEPYKIKKKKYIEFLDQSIVKQALKSQNRIGLSIQRKIILWIIENKCFILLNLIAIVRKWQKVSN